MPTKDDVRTVGLIIKQQIAAIAGDVIPLYEATQDWNFDQADTALPTDEVIAAAVADYEALSNPVIGISDSLLRIKDVTLTTDDTVLPWTTLDARIDALESASVVDLTPIETRLTALESTPAVDLTPIETRLTALESAPAVSVTHAKTDTVIAVYKDATTITIKAGGEYTVSGTLYTVAADFDLSVTSDLSVDDTLVSLTWYHVITNGSVWRFADATTCSDVPGGVALNIGVSIWNSSGLKVRQFTYDGRWYHYLHDAILLYDATMPTTNTTISLAAYVPSQVRRVELRAAGQYRGNANSRLTGAGLYVGDVASASATHFVFSSYAYESVSAVFQASTGRSMAFRCAYAYPSGKLWLQAWSV